MLARSLLFLAALPVTAAAQATFTTESELVVLHVSVADRRGAYVTGLARDDFRVIEDGRPQAISLIAGVGAPATIGLLIDSSISMHPHRALVVAAVSAFAAASHPDDELFALGFNDRVAPALPPSAPFTSERATLVAALERTITARGQTALYDAVSAGLDYVNQGHRDRKVLVVVSDGDDNASRTTLDALVRKAQASNAMIYTIALRDPATRSAQPRVLQQLARGSGGAAYRVTRAGDLAGVLDSIGRDLRHTYTLGYVPAAGGRSGYRAVRVLVNAAHRGPLVVRSRTGYWSGLER